ncbi:transposase [Candidatus Rhabdochlamydia oedothoracis]|uniref:transposase n=1 Tax=Candidatus Rhabdochlamydia oedothoracis TaxID=2720720 RepID=UPI001C646D09
MVFFSRGRGGGEQVDYGYKGKGVTSHLLVEKSGKPLAITFTSASGDEKKQVIPLLRKVIPFIKKAWNQGKVPILEADKGYDSEQTRIDVLSHEVFPLIARKRNTKGYKILFKIFSKLRIFWRKICKECTGTIRIYSRNSKKTCTSYFYSHF